MIGIISNNSVSAQDYRNEFQKNGVLKYRKNFAGKDIFEKNAKQGVSFGNLLNSEKKNIAKIGGALTSLVGSAMVSHSNDVTDLETRLKLHQKTIDMVKEEILKTENEKTKILKDKIGTLEQTKKDLQNKKANFENEKKNIKKEENAIREGKTENSEIMKLSEQIEVLTEQKRVLDYNKDLLKKGYKENLSAVQNAVKSYFTENEISVGNLIYLLSAKSTDIETDIEVFEMELGFMKEEEIKDAKIGERIEKIQKKIDVCTRRIENCDKKISELNGEISAILATDEDIKIQNELLQSEISKFNETEKELKEAQKNLEEANKEFKEPKNGKTNQQSSKHKFSKFQWGTIGSILALLFGAGVMFASENNNVDDVECKTICISDSICLNNNKAKSGKTGVAEFVAFAISNNILDAEIANKLSLTSEIIGLESDGKTNLFIVGNKNLYSHEEIEAINEAFKKWEKSFEPIPVINTDNYGMQIMLKDAKDLTDYNYIPSEFEQTPDNSDYEGLRTEDFIKFAKNKNVPEELLNEFTKYYRIVFINNTDTGHIYTAFELLEGVDNVPSDTAEKVDTILIPIFREMTPKKTQSQNRQNQ